VPVRAENWPRWRGPDGNAVAPEKPLPSRWDTQRNVRWKVAVPGEGYSSPIVWEDRLYLTTALDFGKRRTVLCLDRHTGKTLWSRDVRHDNPERTSALTGHAAATPVTDGRHVVACFGNAGVVCYDRDGKQLWHRDLGTFDSELGLASSPILAGTRVILVCDHDGDRFTSFDSYLIALDLPTGKEVWKTERRGIYRSWSTPILVPPPPATPPSKGGEQATPPASPPSKGGENPSKGREKSVSPPLEGGVKGGWELIVNAQDQLRAYDPDSGKLLWHVTGMTGWVTPSPVYGHGLIFATSGKTGPTLAVRPGGRGDVTASHVAWKEENHGPYVCSPLVYGEHLYVHNEQGILSCYQARTGELLYRQRLEGKFIASAVAGDGKVYLTNETGTTHVVRAGARFELLARNALGEASLASPAVANGEIFLRTERHLYCIGPGKE
jgi:outer membrane protein assembly factor BamB